MFRLNRLFVMITAMTLVLAGCGGSGNTGGTDSSGGKQSGNATDVSATKKKVTINVAMQQHTATDALKKLLPEFEEKTGIKVNFDVLPQEELNNKTALALTSASGQYDIINMFSLFATQYAQAGWVTPLDDLINKTKDADVNDFLKAFIGALSYNNKVYGLPFYGESTMLMYNKELFKAAGIDQPPTTMDELEKDAAKLTKDGKYGIAMRGQRGGTMNVYPWAGFFKSFGGKWLVDGKPAINTDSAVKATELYARLLNKYGPPGAANFSWDQVQLAMQQGTVGMIIDATNFAPRLEDSSNSKVVGKVGYAVVPAGPSGAFPSIFTDALAIPSASKHQEEAFQFINWALSKDVQLRTAIDGLRGDVTRKSVWMDPKFINKYNFEKWSEVTTKSMDMADPEYLPRIAQFTDYSETVSIALSSSLAGGDPKASFDKAQKDSEKYFK